MRDGRQKRDATKGRSIPAWRKRPIPLLQELPKDLLTWDRRTRQRLFDRIELVVRFIHYRERYPHWSFADAVERFGYKWGYWARKRGLRCSASTLYRYLGEPFRPDDRGRPSKSKRRRQRGKRGKRS